MKRVVENKNTFFKQNLIEQKGGTGVNGTFVKDLNLVNNLPGLTDYLFVVDWQVCDNTTENSSK